VEGIPIEIRQLQTFKTVVDCHSFTKAAQALQYSQATITSHIQQLENELGAPLFDRLGKKIQLTNLGRELYPYVGELLTSYAKIRHLAAHEEIKGELRIGASETITIFKLAGVLAAYKKQYPDVTITLVNDHCLPLRERLHTGELDIAITLEPLVEDPQLVTEVCGEELLVLVGSADHTFGDIVEANGACIIFSEPPCSLRRFFERFLTEKGIGCRDHMIFSSMEAMKQCVASGLGISLMPLISVEPYMQAGKMKVIPAEGEQLTFYTQLSYHRNKWMSKAHRLFMEMVMTSCREGSMSE